MNTVKTLVPRGLLLRKDFAGGDLFEEALIEGGLQVLGSAKNNVLYCFLHSQIAIS